jgi:hypothetical protein
MMLALLLAAMLSADTNGAWQHTRADGTVGTLIVADGHFSLAWYRRDPAKFIATEGGAWTPEAGGMRVTYEFDTANPDRVGTTRTLNVKEEGDRLVIDGAAWTRVDGGTPGALKSAWLMTGRKRDGVISTRTPGPRRTMKILSGTRFQWIAYNVETKEFFGTGGGTYTTADGKYTESIEFFSRDDSRAGRSLEFTYELVDGAWHHSGKSTTGEPMYEIWSRRTE